MFFYTYKHLYNGMARKRDCTARFTVAIITRSCLHIYMLTVGRAATSTGRLEGTEEDLRCSSSEELRGWGKEYIACKAAVLSHSKS